jgi:hypothetical protein
MTEKSNLTFTDKIQTQKNDTKPKGLWYGIGTSWIDWIRSEMPNWERNHIFNINIDESKILKISNEEEIINFNEKYKTEKIPMFSLIIINWEEVAKDYSGIEISPYLYKMRHDRRVFWYYGWDVASGCIWNKNAIKSIEKIKI